MFPASCDNNCDFLVTYKVTGSNKVEFELSGIGAWAAVGFSDDTRMVIYIYMIGYLINKNLYLAILGIKYVTCIMRLL